MQCPRCQQDNPVADAQFCPRCGAPAKHDEQRTMPGLSNADLQRELTEAREQQTATSEILQVIASSPTELGPVLDAVAKNAARVCDAEDIGVFQLDDDAFRVGARYGAGPKQDIGSIARIRRDLLLGRTFLERRTIHVHDMAAELHQSSFPSYLRTDFNRTLFLPTRGIAATLAGSSRS